MEFLVDDAGQRIFSWDLTTAAAVWEHGFIHVGEVGSVVVVSICPPLTSGVSLAGAFSEIARLRPALVFLRSDCESSAEVHCRPADAFRRMWDLVAAEGNVPSYPLSFDPQEQPPRDWCFDSSEGPFR
jgi:hypothetical protein